MRLHRLVELALVATVVLGASLAFTWPLAADASATLPGGGDPLYHAWVLGWIADRTGHGLAGVWDAPIFYPYPGSLRFVEPMLGIAVPLAPVYWVSHNAVVLHNVALWVSFVVAGTGGYVLGRDLTGRRAAGVVAAAVAAFVPYRFSHLVHVQVLMAAWLWWAAWALHQYFQQPSLPRALRVATFYCLLGLSSLYWAYIGLLPLATIASVELWRRRPPAGRVLAHALVAGAVCLGAFLPVGLELGALTASTSPITGTVGPVSYGADLLDYVSGRPTLRLWGPVLRAGTGEADLFPGLTAVVCALLALVGAFRRTSTASRSRRDEWTWVYVGLGVVAVLLSFGPSPAYDGRVIVSNPVFSWLTNYVPGFAQMRVPARFVVVAHLALSVLAARGVAMCLDAWQVSSARAAAVAGAVAALVFAEGLGVPVNVERFWPYQVGGDRALYHWLSRHPGDAVLELPLDGWGHRSYSLVYQYRTLLHRHPIVNGMGRFVPPLSDMLADPESPLTEPGRAGEAVALLRAMGVRYVVVHRTWYARRPLGEAIADALSRAAGAPAMSFGESSIVDLGPPGTPASRDGVREMPAHGMRVEASRGDVGRLVDGDPATRWITGPQAGTDWIEIALPSVTVVSGVRLRLGPRSLNDYPRGLDVSASAGGDPLAPVFTGSTAGALGAALRLAPEAPSIELRWSPTPVQRLRLRQTGGRSRWYWSVHELRLLIPES